VTYMQDVAGCVPERGQGTAQAGPVKVNNWYTLRGGVSSGIVPPSTKPLALQHFRRKPKHQLSGGWGLDRPSRGNSGRLFSLPFASAPITRQHPKRHQAGYWRESTAKSMSHELNPNHDVVGRIEPEPAPRHREPLFNLPGIVSAIIALCVAIHLIRLYVLSDAQNVAVIVNGAFFPIRYSGQYALDIWAFTSPLTSSLLHAGWMHLIVNMIWLAAFGSPLANRLGVVRFVLFWCFAVLVSLLFHYVSRPDDAIPVVGASGAISGMMGAAARFGFRTDRSGAKPNFAGQRLTLMQTLQTRQVLVFLGVWLAINFAAGAGLDVSGAAGSVAWEAHIGGMVAGLLAIGLFDPGGRRLPQG